MQPQPSGFWSKIIFECNNSPILRRFSGKIRTTNSHRTCRNIFASIGFTAARTCRRYVYRLNICFILYTVKIMRRRCKRIWPNHKSGAIIGAATTSCYLQTDSAAIWWWCRIINNYNIVISDNRTRIQYIKIRNFSIRKIACTCFLIRQGISFKYNFFNWFFSSIKIVFMVFFRTEIFSITWIVRKNSHSRIKA